MKSIWPYLKLSMINVFVLLIVLLSINLLASIYLDGRSLWKKIFVPINEKAYTESLPDQVQAYLIYREKKQLETHMFPMSPGPGNRFLEKPLRSIVRGTARII